MIYFIRHGETDFNKEGRMQGHMDIPLNNNGIAQAEMARDELAEFYFDMIYSSPLQRAKKTAEIINEKQNVKVIIDERIKEINGGELQGKIRKELSEDMELLIHNNPESLGIETSAHLCERVESFFKEIENLDKNILIVAHGGVYRALYRYLNNIEVYEFEFKRIENAKAVRLK